MIAGLLPAGAESAEAFGDDAGERPYPGEEDLIARAVDGRRREFVTTRRCAREALGRLGIAPGPIRPGPRREPRWPPGIVGSMTHCAGYRAAAVAPRTVAASLGIDAEPHAPLPDGVEAAVTAGAESGMLARLSSAHPGIRWDRLLFSAKESVYKAWYPLTGRWLGFDDACLTVDPSTATFTAEIAADGTRTDGGPPLRRLHGRFLVARGLVLTEVTVPPLR